MKLSKFCENVNTLLKENPEMSDYEVVICVDEDCVGDPKFRPVFYKPTVGYYDQIDFFGKFNEIETLFAYPAVCVN